MWCMQYTAIKSWLGFNVYKQSGSLNRLLRQTIVRPIYIIGRVRMDNMYQAVAA